MQTVNLPKRVMEKMLHVTVAFEELHDELEDYLIASRPALVKKLRQARREHLRGKVHPFVVPQ